MKLGRLLVAWHINNKRCDKWQYSHLNVFVRNFKHHTPKQWEVIHVKLTKLFIIDPPLKPSIVEKYLQKHLNFTRHKWRWLWKVGRDAIWPKGCPIHAWNSLVKYWKIPFIEHENKQILEVHAMVNNPWKMGQCNYNV